MGDSGLPQRGGGAENAKIQTVLIKLCVLRLSAPLRLIRAKVRLPLRLDPFCVRFAVVDEEAVSGDVGFSGVDGPVAIL